ncbi:MAG TPA: nuclear transport factor 2 family protein [Chitinophagaceae bacterium]|nr:nuclear transport factor 2 family protein [Chitinophagaceae bacterium]
MQTLQITSESVFQHHLAALGNNDLNELIKDYTEESEVWTPDGDIVGLKAISSFFSYAFTLFPKDKTTLDIKKMIAKDYKVYIVWTADSPIVNVPFATDSFEIKEGKILWQSTAFQMVQK